MFNGLPTPGATRLLGRVPAGKKILTPPSEHFSLSGLMTTNDPLTLSDTRLLRSRTLSTVAGSVNICPLAAERLLSPTIDGEVVDAADSMCKLFGGEICSSGTCPLCLIIVLIPLTSNGCRSGETTVEIPPATRGGGGEAKIRDEADDWREAWPVTQGAGRRGGGLAAMCVAEVVADDLVEISGGGGGRFSLSFERTVTFFSFILFIAHDCTNINN